MCTTIRVAASAAQARLGAAPSGELAAARVVGYAKAMRVETSTKGVRITAAEGAIALGPARPQAVAGGGDGKPQHWCPASVEVRDDRLVAPGGPSGACIELVVRILADGAAEIRGRLRNDGSQPLRIERLILLATDQLRIGADARNWRIYRNGYQSWAGTHTLGVTEVDRDFTWRVARVATTDARHRAPNAPGHVRSDALTAICEPVSNAALALGFTTLADAFVYVEVESAAVPQRLTCWADFDGMQLAPGESTPEITIRLAAESGARDSGWQALRRVASDSGAAMRARGHGRTHPTGWCSWYYYFEKVTEKDVLDNLEVLATDGRGGPRFGCEYVMVDDGHQIEIGDWLTTSPSKFPSGMAEIAARIHAAGFDAGIWWAPFFVAPRSAVARAHPEWLVRNQRGRPITGNINPAWGITKPMRVLDTTNPAVLDHLAETARAIGTDWGYEIQKLDFLYAAALPGVRHDRNATRAQSLRRGLEAIRRGAGDAAFLLGCGCPLGPAVGVVDAMRIGADVTPYWTNWLARVVLLNTHGLATRHALLNTVTRAVLDHAWWLNDPDCLMLRDTESKLTEEEVRLMATVFAMTDGMIVLSDRLDRLSEGRLDLLAKARALAGGEPVVVDLFEHAIPQVLLSRHPDRIDIAAINLGDEPARRTIALAGLVGTDGDGDRCEYWTGQPVPVRAGVADFGEVPAHAARVLSFPAPKIR